METQLKALYIDTLKKELRNKSLLFAFIFSTMCIFLAYAIMKVIFGQFAPNMGVDSKQAPMLVSGMFSFLNLWAGIISIYFGVNAMRSDFQNNIIYQYLSFPISRFKYMAVRLLGTWSIVFGFYIYSYLLTMILFMSINKGITPTFGQFFSILVMGIYTLFYISLSFVVSFYLSTLGAFLTMIFTWIVIAMSNNSFLSQPFSEYLTNLSLLKVFGLIVFTFLPHIGALNAISNHFLYEAPIELNLFIEIPHFLLTSAVIIFIGKYFIKKKDF